MGGRARRSEGNCELSPRALVHAGAAVAGPGRRPRRGPDAPEVSHGRCLGAGVERVCVEGGGGATGLGTAGGGASAARPGAPGRTGCGARGPGPRPRRGVGRAPRPSPEALPSSARSGRLGADPCRGSRATLGSRAPRGGDRSAEGPGAGRGGRGGRRGGLGSPGATGGPTPVPGGGGPAGDAAVRARP